ncbi:methyl-accepting chemotaxis protein [Azohydromonas australica]|uniref:methyl-accepting chemotaxis protein n=1 Tax=Azohydromonas australica TaxID=364039 RepID=UPI00042440D1|nr:methyl-accepting chemotaxis protein [Azohydromonas australica]
MRNPSNGGISQFLFSRLSISARLYVGFGVALALLAAVGTLNWFQTSLLSERTRILVEEDARRASLANDMQIAVQDMVIVLGKLVLIENLDEIENLRGSFKATVERYFQVKDALAKLPVRSESGGWQEAFETMTSFEESALPLFKQVADMAGDTKPGLLQYVYSSQVSNPQKNWMESLGDLRKLMGETMAAASAQSREDARQSQWLTAGIVVIALAGGLLSALLISHSITRPLHRAVDVAKTVAQGDLSANVRTGQRDEIGLLLNSLAEMQDALRHVVGDIRLCADSIQVASSEVASGKADLSQRTEITAGNLQQTASSLEELTGAVRQSADSAATANQLALSASQAAQRGGEVVQQVIANMADISTSSRRIGDIIGVIDGIAFQTNLLALNAAVEAARAGEQGRGFAVVAGEVRNLAQRAASAAREIKSLIGESVQRVESGTKLVQEAGGTMQDMMSAVQRVADVIDEISTATVEQSQGIEQVNGAVVELDRMTQQNAALVEQSTASAELLSEQAGRLNKLVSAFHLG